ncbi:MAG: hypothetical protein H6559_22025 [Lewinellaceae bacterium]|nr:hypothetical protein [Lewinellaceae bacterium]
MKKPKKEKDTGKVFETRRAAFREAKRDHGVPVGKQPDEVVKPYTQIGDEITTTENDRPSIHIRSKGTFGLSPFPWRQP